MRDKLTEYENTISNLFFFLFFSDNIFRFCYIKVTIFRIYFFLGMILYGLFIDSKILPPRVYRQIESKELHRGHLYSLWILFSNNNSLFKMMANYVCNFWQPFYASDEDRRKFLMEVTKVFSISIANNDVRCQKSRGIFWCWLINKYIALSW